MAIVGTLKGAGHAVFRGRRFNAAYRIGVWRTPYLKSGAGIVELDSPSEAMEVFEAGAFTLDMGGGRTVELVGKKLTMPGATVEVLTSGAIPGF